MADTFRCGQITAGDAGVHNIKALAAGITSGLATVLKASNNNTGLIYVGPDNSVSAATGFELGPGDALPMEIINPGKLWIIQTVAADRLCWATVGA